MSRTISDELLPHIRVVQQNGSERDASFKYIWNACFSSVRSAIIKAGLQDPDVDDVVQDTFLALLKKPERYDPERSSVLTYLCAIARNRAVDFIRGNERRTQRNFNYAREVSLEETGIQTSTPNKHDTYELLNKLVDEGWEDIDIVIIRSFARGESLSEIASRLNLPTPTVKTRWFRFRKLFKKQHEHRFAA